jgi:hypothetical protein
MLNAIQSVSDLLQSLLYAGLYVNGCEGRVSGQRVHKRLQGVSTRLVKEGRGAAIGCRMGYVWRGGQDLWMGLLVRLDKARVLRMCGTLLKDLV